MLYGLTINADTPRDLRETIFFDSLDKEGGRAAPRPFSPRWLQEATLGWTVPQALDVPIQGHVVSRALAGRLPQHDRILNVPDLFQVAERYFRRHKRFLRIRIPDPPSIMHWTYPLPILLEGARNVYTLHDLVPLRLPFTTLDNKRWYDRLIRGCLQWGDHVCTVSEASKQDIQTLFDAAPERITNTYQSSMQQPPSVDGEAGLATWLQGLFELDYRGYFLFFGALEPKKNVGRLIEAYLASGVQTPLVIVGGRAWKSEMELRLVRTKDGSPLVAARRVRLMEYMPGTWLTGLIRGARAVVFPSLYEGFGLPVLEAMQQGTPVLTSNTSSLPEVAGQAAVLVDPYDTDAIATGLRRLDGDASLRDSLAQAGRQQAVLFDMDHYTARIATLYETVMAAPKGVSAS